MNKNAKQAADDTPETDRMAAFESSLAELEALVENLEGGELSLDESLKAFGRGVKLFRDCRSTLETAELRVRELLDPEDPDSSRPLAEHVRKATKTGTSKPQAEGNSSNGFEDDDIPF